MTTPKNTAQTTASTSDASRSANNAAATEIGKQIEYLARALKAPRIREAAARLGDQARDAGWSHEEYLAAVLDREVAARDASGAQLRTRAAGFGATKTIEDFVFDHQPGLRRDLIAHLATGTFLAKAENVVLLGPPGTGKTHLAIGSSSKPPRPATECCSRPRPNGSPDSKPPTTPAGSPTSSPGYAATGC